MQCEAVRRKHKKKKIMLYLVILLLAGLLAACAMTRGPAGPQGEKGDPGGKQAEIQVLRGIAELFPDHIWKEDYLLFPLTNKVLSSQEQQASYQQFEEVEKTVGRDVHRRLEQLAEWLEQQIQRTYRSGKLE
jgi:hypothetical protein